MKIAAARLHPYHLPLRSEWATAAGSFGWRAGWLLRLETDDGRCGYGDCAPLPASGTESAEIAATALRAATRTLAGMRVADALASLPDPAAFATLAAPAARCAVETAVLDLLAQAASLPLADYLRGSAGTREVAVNAALGSLLRVAERDILGACDDGFSVLKLKVGTEDIAQELARLRQIAALLPAGVRLRLDANRAWRPADAERFLAACAGLPIEMLEEPLADPQPEALRRLQANCAFPLALDESGPCDAQDRFFAAAPVRRLVLKPPRLGGLLPALALARRASGAGLQCIVTSSIDSACGVLAAAQLAAALDNAPDNALAHGLATSAWLAQDSGTPPRIAGGRLSLSGTPGLGFVPRHGLDFA